MAVLERDLPSWSCSSSPARPPSPARLLRVLLRAQRRGAAASPTRAAAATPAHRRRRPSAAATAAAGCRCCAPPLTLALFAGLGRLRRVSPVAGLAPRDVASAPPPPRARAAAQSPKRKRGDVRRPLRRRRGRSGAAASRRSPLRRQPHRPRTAAIGGVAGRGACGLDDDDDAASRGLHAGLRGLAVGRRRRGWRDRRGA